MCACVYVGVYVTVGLVRSGLGLDSRTVLRRSGARDGQRRRLGRLLVRLAPQTPARARLLKTQSTLVESDLEHTNETSRDTSRGSLGESGVNFRRRMRRSRDSISSSTPSYAPVSRVIAFFLSCRARAERDVSLFLFPLSL